MCSPSQRVLLCPHIRLASLRGSQNLQPRNPRRGLRLLLLLAHTLNSRSGCARLLFFLLALALFYYILRVARRTFAGRQSVARAVKAATEVND